VCDPRGQVLLTNRGGGGGRGTWTVGESCLEPDVRTRVVGRWRGRVGGARGVGVASGRVAIEKGSAALRTGGRVVKDAALRRGSDREQAARALVPSTRGRGRRSLAASLQVQVRMVGHTY